MRKSRFTDEQMVSIIREAEQDAAGQTLWLASQAPSRSSPTSAPAVRWGRPGLNGLLATPEKAILLPTYGVFHVFGTIKHPEWRLIAKGHEARYCAALT